MPSSAAATDEHGRRAGTPVELVPDDFEIEQTEHLTRSSTVLMLDLSMSMPMEGRFVPAKKVAMALQALIASQFPRDYLGVVVFSETARVIRAAEIPEASWDYVYGTNMHHALTLARQLLGRQHGSKQIIMVTDGEPTAHVLPDGEVYFHYPPVRETIEATLREVVRCTNAGNPHQHVHARGDAVAEGVRRADLGDQPRTGVLRHAGEPRRLRARRLHRAAAHAVPARPGELSARSPAISDSPDHRLTKCPLART